MIELNWSETHLLDAINSICGGWASELISKWVAKITLSIPIYTHFSQFDNNRALNELTIRLNNNSHQCVRRKKKTTTTTTSKQITFTFRQHSAKRRKSTNIVAYIAYNFNIFIFYLRTIVLLYTLHIWVINGKWNVDKWSVEKERSKGSYGSQQSCTLICAAASTKSTAINNRNTRAKGEMSIDRSKTKLNKYLIHTVKNTYFTQLVCVLNW